MERFPREGDFEIVNPKTVRCNICKKDIHLASEGTVLPYIETRDLPELSRGNFSFDILTLGLVSLSDFRRLTKFGNFYCRKSFTTDRARVRQVQQDTCHDYTATFSQVVEARLHAHECCRSKCSEWRLWCHKIVRILARFTGSASKLSLRSIFSFCEHVQIEYRTLV